jgi:hypothetical protein
MSRRIAPILEGSAWQRRASSELPPGTPCAALDGYFHAWNAVREVCAFHSRNQGTVSLFVSGRRRLAAGGR